MAGGVFGTLLLCWCWRGGLHSLLSTAGSSQTSLTPASVCRLSAQFRTQKHGPRCRLGFCRPDASITPSARRTDAAAQSAFLQILMRFLFIFSDPLCLNIITACTVYLKCSVSFKSMFYGKSISIRNIVQILSNWLNWYCLKPLIINQLNYIWYSILMYQVLNLKQPRINVTNDLLLLLLLI